MCMESSASRLVPGLPSPAAALARAAGGQALCLVVGACVFSYASIVLEIKWRPPKPVGELTVREARSKQTDFVWVDVRNSERFEGAHIPGAVHFSEAEAEASLEAVRRVWRPGRKLAVYGEGIGSDRAERVAKSLKTALGTREVYLLEGGWAAWPRP